MSMKRIFSVLAAAAAAVCCVLPFGMQVSAERPVEDTIPSCKLYDPDGLFTDQEQTDLSQSIRAVSDETDQYVAVYVMNESGEGLSDYQVETFADDKYDELFNIPYGKETDGLMLVLDMPTHYIYITTSGLGELYYYNGTADDRISQMVENLKSYLRSENNSGAVTQFCNDVRKYHDRGFPVNAYTYNSDNGQYYFYYNGTLQSADKLPWWFGKHFKEMIPVGLIIGVIAGIVSVLIVKSRYKLVKSLDPGNYVSKNDTNFYVQEDHFLREHTVKHRIDTERSGGGGGGGGGGSSHSSSGGFSHGGGGGHW